MIQGGELKKVKNCAWPYQQICGQWLGQWQKDFLITIDKTASNFQIPIRNSKNTESFKKLIIKNKK